MASIIPGKLPGTHSVKVDNERVIPLMMVIRVRNCSHCQSKIKKDTKVIAVGAPHHTLIHFNCWPHYKYDSAYPHDRPLSTSPGF
jgi:hypothetical protein